MQQNKNLGRRNNMQSYSVTWQITLDADSPIHAAQLAREIQLDPASIATVFDVIEGDAPRPLPLHGTVRVDTRNVQRMHPKSRL